MCGLAIAAQESPQAAKSKPLQRCDQGKGEAELQCLEKARERIVQAREKRLKSSAENGNKKSGSDNPKK